MVPIEGPWSTEDDEMLINLFLLHGSNWSLISNSIPGKSVKTCLSRLLSLLGKDGLMDQTVGRWSPEEDEMLINLIFEHGFRLSVIGKPIPGKSVETCWSRLFSLFGKGGVMDLQTAGRWSAEEDEMLLNLFEKHGSNWSLISKSIPGKSPAKCWARQQTLAKNDPDQIERLWSPEEDEMLINLMLEHGFRWSLIGNSIPGKSVETCLSRMLSLLVLDQTAGRWSPEEDEMLLNLFEKHGSNWSLISKSIPGKSPAKCWSRWRSLAKNDTDQIERLWSSEEDEIDEDEIEMFISDHNIHDLTLRLALGGVSDQAPSNGDMAMETGSQNSIYEGNSSHEVGGMVSGQPPSISDMARGNMSSGGTHSYSRDHSAPSWNALYKRDSSPMMIDSDSVQQFVGSEFGRKDFSEVSSKA